MDFTAARPQLIARMPIYSAFIAAFWLILIVVWAVSAFGAKRSSGGRAWGREIELRIGILVVVVLALRLPFARKAWRSARAHAVNTSMALGIIGVVLCGLGVGLALWARFSLGANWGLPMSRKENPELVTNGPYAFARHPIYGGIILGMLGSALAQSVFWLAPLLLFGFYFIYSARHEERLMSEQFPQAYPAYRQRTKMFIPYIV
jgi:protein-S-isoprenylcysteine O-methyltransferase Ste14